MFDLTDLRERLSRRAFLTHSAGGLGALSLAQLLAADERGDHPTAPVATRASAPPHLNPRAKSVICLFQHGGPSQMDLFDPKPELNRLHGQPYPGEIEAHFVAQKGKLLGSPFQFQKRGNAGIEISELLPETGAIVDELTLVRSMTTDSIDHESALRVIHAGKTFAGRPVWGSWVVYALGSMQRDLPAYVVLLSDAGGLPVDGPLNWSPGFLPGNYQGTVFRTTGTPVVNLQRPADVSEAARQNQLKFLRDLNLDHLRRRGDADLQARISSFELAARMQLSVPEALDLGGETAETLALYGVDRPATEQYGRSCLLARRLVERGVRFVQIFLAGQPWDTHAKNADNLRLLTRKTDRPCAALVQDLKRRGLLDSTIVLWTGEFGRLPISQGDDGRDHNRRAFSLWLAGGGFRQGYAHGTTDEFSYRSVDQVVRVCDLHATLLHALGLDHTRVSYRVSGRDETLTDAEVTRARPVFELLA